MAEHKTYTCDICGVQGAKRFIIPDVHRERDGTKIDGPVDLCLDHTELLVYGFIFEADLSWYQRRKVWKYAKGYGEIVFD